MLFRNSLEIGGLQDLCEADAVPVVLFPFHRLGGAAPTGDVQRTRQPLYVTTLRVEREQDFLFSSGMYIQICTGASISPRKLKSLNQALV